MGAAALMIALVLPSTGHGGLIQNTTAFWPADTNGITRINISWGQTGFAAERAIILNAIRGTWGQVAKIDFVDRGFVVESPSVVVNIQSIPTGARSGQTSPAGKPVLGSFSTVTLVVPVGRNFEALRYLAVHEFGHVLGFQHEQDSPLRDGSCSKQGIVDVWGNVTQLGGRGSGNDSASVMSSDSGCNAYANSIGYLSPGDVDSVRALYGFRKVRCANDFDGGGTSDWATWEPASGWIYDGASQPRRWGEVGDVIVPGDYNGDGVADRAIWRPSTGQWWIDVPGIPAIVWGQQGDFAVPEDYNGDGKTDQAIYRPITGQWWISLAGFPQGLVFGSPGDIPVPADYDGDGKAEIAVWRPSTGEWKINSSNTELQGFFGMPGDTPMPGDYVGEGRARAAVYRSSIQTWLFSVRPPFLDKAEARIPNATGAEIPVKGRFTGQLHEEVAVFDTLTGTFRTRTGGFRNRGPARSLPVGGAHPWALPPSR